MKNLQHKNILLFFIIAILLWGCQSMIYEDLKDCPQGGYVKFYSKTTCENDTLFVGEVPTLTVFAFDDKGKLNAVIEQENVDLKQDFDILVPISDGDYSLIAWAGVDEKFRKHSVSIGVTTMQDVMLSIDSANDNIARLNSIGKIWHGKSSTICLPDPSEYGSLYEHTTINLKEITTRVRVIVEFDETVKVDLDPAKLDISLSSANGVISIDGQIPSNIPLLPYEPIDIKIEDNISIWDYSMLNLTPGCKSKLNITYNASSKKETVFSGDLISSILLKAADKGINLDCEKDFTVRFVVKEFCSDCKTPFSSSIYINDWLIYSYSTDL